MDKEGSLDLIHTIKYISLIFHVKYYIYKNESLQ